MWTSSAAHAASSDEACQQPAAHETERDWERGKAHKQTRAPGVSGFAQCSEQCPRNKALHALSCAHTRTLCVLQVLAILTDCGFTEDRFFIHCDGALFGMMMPFLKQAPMVSFRKPIGSVSVSGHKFVGAPVPCGVVITRFK